jgi:hypothetical protein
MHSNGSYELQPRPIPKPIRVLQLAAPNRVNALRVKLGLPGQRLKSRDAQRIKLASFPAEIGVSVTCWAIYWAVPNELGLEFFALFVAAGAAQVGSPGSTADPSS